MTFGELLSQVVPPGDTAARLGADEFAVLLEDDSGPMDATAVAERIMAARCGSPSSSTVSTWACRPASGSP